MSSTKTGDPSWAEVRNFIQFLDAQLCDCEGSPFCNADDLKGFKEFVVKFAILMAKVFYKFLIIVLTYIKPGVH